MRMRNRLLQKSAIDLGIDLHPLDWGMPLDGLHAELRRFVEEGYVWLKTPFPVIKEPTYSKPLESYVVPVWEGGKTEMVEPDALITIQHQVSAEGILYYLDNPEFLNLPKRHIWWDMFPVIMKTKGQMLLREGNHRAVAALVLGEKLKSTVVHMDDLTSI